MILFYPSENLLCIPNVCFTFLQTYEQSPSCLAGCNEHYLDKFVKAIYMAIVPNFDQNQGGPYEHNFDFYQEIYLEVVNIVGCSNLKSYLTIDRF